MICSMQILEPTVSISASVAYFGKKNEEYSGLLYPEENPKPHEYTDLGEFLLFSDRDAPIACICAEPKFSHVLSETSLPVTTTRKELALRILGIYRLIRTDDAELASVLNRSKTDNALFKELSAAILHYTAQPYSGAVYFKDKMIILPEDASSFHDKGVIAEEGAHLAVASYKHEKDIVGRYENFASEIIGMWARIRELELLGAHNDVKAVIDFLERPLKDDSEPALHKAAYCAFIAAKLSNGSAGELEEKIRLLAKAKIDSSDTAHKILLGNKYSRLS